LSVNLLVRMGLKAWAISYPFWGKYIHEASGSSTNSEWTAFSRRRKLPNSLTTDKVFQLFYSTLLFFHHGFYQIADRHNSQYPLFFYHGQMAYAAFRHYLHTSRNWCLPVNRQEISAHHFIHRCLHR